MVLMTLYNRKANGIDDVIQYNRKANGIEIVKKRKG